MQLEGTHARIERFVRLGGRCPANDFLSEIEHRFAKRFKGQFDALTKRGIEYVNDQRFCPLHGDGKPLWEFKGHDHRLYCLREVTHLGGIKVVLFNGWIKQKVGKHEKEKREIARAISLYQGYVNGGRA